MDQKSSSPKWEFMVSINLKKSKPHQIWNNFTDFFNLHKWFPGLAACDGVHGTNGEPGCIRYCSGFSLPSSGGVSWSTERLVAVDHVNRSLVYEIVDCNIGFKSYVLTVKISPGLESDGCKIEWFVTVDPVDGVVMEDLVSKYQVGLQLMGMKMEEAIKG